MTEQDYDAFLVEYKRLSAALERFKQTPEDVVRKSDVYFHVLKRFPLREVTAKADSWLARESKMPKPAEWAAVVITAPAVEIPVLPEGAAREWLSAERDRWERTPCACRECAAAGVSDLPRRFVPEFDANGQDRHVRIGGRIVTAGHWAHGQELAGYWVAREAFWAKYDEMFPNNKRKGKHGPEFASEFAEAGRTPGRHAQGFETLARKA